MDKVLKRAKKPYNSGITLVALVVTIIVLIILAGVSINLILGENGITTRAREAKEKQIIAQYEDYISLAISEVHMDDWKEKKESIVLLNQIQDILEKNEYFNGSTYRIQEYEKKDSLIIKTKEGYIFVVTENSYKYIEDDIILEDIVEPIISLSASTTEWTNQDVVLTGKSQDEESGLIAYAWTDTAQEPTETSTTGELGKWTEIAVTTEEITQTITLSSNTTKYFLTKDRAENVNITAITISKIDKEEPTDVSISASPVRWSGNIGTATLTGTGKDELAGVNAYQFSTNASLTASSSGWTSITATTEEITQTKDVTTSGTYYFYVKDQAGNINKSTGVTVTIGDAIEPIISLIADKTGWTNTAITLTGKSQDTESGLVAYGWTESATEPTTWTNIAQTTSEITQTKSVTKNATYYFWTKDGTGNVNNTSIVISKYDATAPSTATISAGSVSWSGSTGTVKLTGTGKDELAGVNAYQFSTNASLTASSSGWTSITATTSTTTQTKNVTTSGTYYFYVKDQAGNIKKSTGVTVTIADTTKPTISVSANTTSSANSVTLTGKSTDTGSGLVGYAWTTSATQPTSWTSITQTTSQITQTKTVTTNATYYFWTKDGKGNINNASVAVNNCVQKVVINSFNGTTLLRGNSGSTSLNYSGTPASKAYSSSNTGIVTVNSNGNVTASSSNTGSAKITVTLTNYDGTKVSAECTVTVNQGVATIIAKNKDYANIESAISDISSQGTIDMLADTSESTTVPYGKTITLNLNYKTITGCIGNNGTLNIVGSFAENDLHGGGNIKNSDAAIANGTTGTLTITRCYVEASNANAWAVANNGKLIIDGAEIKNAANSYGGGAAVYSNGGEVEVKAMSLIDGGNNFGLALDGGKTNIDTAKITNSNKNGAAFMLRNGATGTAKKTDIWNDYGGTAVANYESDTSRNSGPINNCYLEDCNLIGTIVGAKGINKNNENGEISYTIRIWCPPGIDATTPIACPTWTEAGGQDDIQWYQLEYGQDDYGTAYWNKEIKVSDHGGEKGIYYSQIYFDGTYICTFTVNM